MTAGLDILYPHAGGRGWDTVTTMVDLAGELLCGTVHRLDGSTRPSVARRLLGRLPRRRGARDCLVVAPQPMQLSYLLGLRTLRGYRRIVAWVIDSFWDDRIPQVAQGRGHFDHVCITDFELVRAWQERTKTPVSWLPFGADVLGHGAASGQRPVDLQMVGRQPSAWADEDVVAAAGRTRGVTVASHVPYVDADPAANQQALRDAMGRAKFTLSFTNRLSPASYTHTSREYLTGRWTEALAVGATVAGVAPACHATDVLLWPEATLDLGRTDLADGMGIVAAAASEWTPARARLNHRMALERLDWRPRLRELASLLDREAPVLDAELARLDEAIASARAAS